ncbi:hypothetical protein DSM104440_00579 [Usitatibacter palustris]|jgi:hypothetical protein|uniref:Uncharacterized protein n=1 Tax=Usitatibacter palustris TaxID=2732487 RepID=A0A6M4H2M3_9PROT|nr:hypothetical protein DSM104440_00579 [Usitatibacter palustris]
MRTAKRKTPMPSRELIERARKDLEEGQENTDCHEADRPAGSHCDVPKKLPVPQPKSH